MNFASLSILAAVMLIGAPIARLCAADPAQPSAAENRLRETLRSSLLQLRNAENDKAVLQAAQAEMEEKNKALTSQVEAQAKQSAADKDAADKSIATLQAKMDERDKDIADLRESLDKWKADHKRITDVANTKEAQRAKLEEQVIQLDRRVADQQTKNAGMYKIANEILQRYEKFGLGDALSAREPFTGITRVKLQSLFEDYRDKLVDQKIKPPEAKVPEPATAPAPDKAPKAKGKPDKAPDPKTRS
jgi:hypothetical protein